MQLNSAAVSTMPTAHDETKINIVYRVTKTVLSINKSSDANSLAIFVSFYCQLLSQFRRLT